MSSLSIEKLQRFAQANGYHIHKIFTRNSKCFLVEMMSVKSVDFILLHIPAKYEFQRFNYHSYPLRMVSLDETHSSDDIDNYAHISEDILESAYSTQTDSHIPDKTELPISQHLDQTYKTNIILKDIEGKDAILIKDIHRQIRRLKYCMRGMAHKLAIMNAPYLGILDDQNKISIYHSDLLKRDGVLKLYVVVDFKMFYDRIDVLDQECTQIFKGIFQVLNNNQDIHSKNIKRIMAKQETIFEQSDFLQTCKEKFSNYITQYTELLGDLYKYEADKTEELTQAQTVEPANIHHDMKQNHKKTKLEKELHLMQSSKKELIKALVEVKSKREDLALTIDTILFDNIVMLDKIFKNFAQLDKLQVQLS